MKIRRAYGECARSGKIVPLDQLVQDGYITGLIVASDWYEPHHPLDDPEPYGDERHEVPAPELSTPPGEGTAAPPLMFDVNGKLI